MLHWHLFCRVYRRISLETEIVQNNNSMKFDLLETGNSSSSGPDSNNLFNNLLGNVDIENTDREQDNQMSVDEELHTDKNIHEILSVLSEGNLKLDEDTIKEIKIRLKHLFEMIKLNVDTEANINPEQAHSFICLLYTSPSPRDKTVSRMPSSA